MFSSSNITDLQTFKPSNLQTFKPSNLQTFKPSNLRTSKTLRFGVRRRKYGIHNRWILQ
jgi:hypothetical protein